MRGAVLPPHQYAFMAGAQLKLRDNVTSTFTFTFTFTCHESRKTLGIKSFTIVRRDVCMHLSLVSFIMNGKTKT
jgi:hypothetical protein